MRDAYEVELDDGNIVQLKDMGNGCYVELYVPDDDPNYRPGQPDGYERTNGQYLLKPKTVFRNVDSLPLSDDLRLDVMNVLNDAVEWVQEGAGSEKEWFDSTTRKEKLLHYVDNVWDNDDALIREVAEELVRQNVMVCNRTGDLFTLGEWGRTTGNYVATVASDETNRCPKCGAPKDEFWECIKSSRRTRVPNKYKCQNCGKTKKGITTG